MKFLATIFLFSTITGTVFASYHQPTAKQKVKAGYRDAKANVKENNRQIKNKAEDVGDKVKTKASATKRKIDRKL